MALDTVGNNLIVADAYYGIWLVNLDNNQKKNLVAANEPIPLTDGKVWNRKYFLSSLFEQVFLFVT
jgi:adipocyte plasma membrane-associated protein